MTVVTLGRKDDTLSPSLSPSKDNSGNTLTLGLEDRTSSPLLPQEEREKEREFGFRGRPSVSVCGDKIFPS